MKIKFQVPERILSAMALSMAMFITILGLTHSATISLSVSLVATFIYSSIRRASNKRTSAKFSAAVPQIIDYVISGVQSGLSLTEALINLKIRGPLVSRKVFEAFENSIREGKSFERAISEIQEEFDNSSADQLLEALVFAKTLGGSELLTLLRQLAAFIRRDLALREEIEAKQGWVRNSAHVSAAAPWLLLLLLAVQPSTAEAYSTFTGILVLAFGAFATFLAYLWMSRLSRLPQPSRVFGGRQ
jgi:tight adherence protein B